ncbi:hypothetical protein NW759_001561 [Fusarium solani]|nr:hypothetical protein NW759_001561 [Fusarium solani]
MAIDQTRTEPGKVQPTVESRDLFLPTGVTHGIILPEFPSKKKIWESSIDAGTWIEDLFKEDEQKTEDEPGESPCKKRKRQVKGKESPNKSRQNRKDARRCSAKAFLSVVADSNDLVNFREGLTLDDWKIRCLKNRDYYEQRLTDHYNRELVVASARQLIIQWAEDGSTPNGMPIIHINSCPELREPKLVSPRIRAYHESFILAMDKAGLAVPKKQAQ